jgi:hypothetical protein
MYPFVAFAAALQDGTPNTVPYLILGYVIIGTVGLGYVATLLWRQRNLLRDIDMLDMLQREEPE